MTTNHSVMAKMLEIASRGDMYIPTHGTGPTLPLVPLSRDQHDMVLPVLEAMNMLPRFVFSDELTAVASSEEAELSALDMQRAGCFRLPFPDIVVEPIVSETHDRVVVVARQSKKGDGQAINATAFTLTGRQKFGREVVVVPRTVSEAEFVMHNEEPMFRHSHVTAPWNNSASMDMQITMQNEAKRVSAAIGLGVMCATVVLSTIGLRRETHSFERLNRHRSASGKPALRDYTYISLSRVYRGASGNESEPFDRRSPRPHWRRGHSRRIVHGPGRTERYWKWFEPRMVALAEDATVPQTHEYRVTK